MGVSIDEVFTIVQHHVVVRSFVFLLSRANFIDRARRDFVVRTVARVRHDLYRVNKFVVVVDPLLQRYKSITVSSGKFGNPNIFVLVVDAEDDCVMFGAEFFERGKSCLLYTSPSPRDATLSRMPSSA